MKIPSKLKIRKSIWSIKFDRDRCDSYMGGSDGLCDRNKREIILNPAQSSNELDDTLLHEILHAAWPANACSDNKEEYIISKLTPVLLAALKSAKLLRD